MVRMTLKGILAFSSGYLIWGGFGVVFPTFDWALLAATTALALAGIGALVIPSPLSFRASRAIAGVTLTCMLLIPPVRVGGYAGIPSWILALPAIGLVVAWLVPLIGRRFYGSHPDKQDTRARKTVASRLEAGLGAILPVTATMAAVLSMNLLEAGLHRVVYLMMFLLGSYVSIGFAYAISKHLSSTTATLTSG